MSRPGLERAGRSTSFRRTEGGEEFGNQVNSPASPHDSGESACPSPPPPLFARSWGLGATVRRQSTLGHGPSTASSSRDEVYELLFR